MARLAAENPFDDIKVPERPEAAELLEWHELYIGAFQALMHDRVYGGLGSPLHIPYTAISQYARDHGILAADFDVFVGLVRALDDEWLDYVAKKAGKERN